MSTLILRVEPSHNARYFHLLPDGKTIEELISMVRDIPDNVWSNGRAAIGGTEVPRSWWSRVRIKSGTALSLTIYPKGGGGDTKEIISIVALIAVIAAASFVSAGALAPFLGAGFAAGTFGAQAAALGLTVVGQLAISALAPPPIASNDGTASFQAREIAGVTGNPLSRRDYVPRVLGKMRVSPPHVMFPWTELIDGEVVANAMVGLAGSHSVDDIWINNAKIEDFTGIEHQIRNGFSTDTNIDLFDGKSGVEQGVGSALSNFLIAIEDVTQLLSQDDPESSYPKYQNFKTRGTADEFLIRLFWPAGMTQGTSTRAMHPVAFQFRLVGSDTWINGPELFFCERDAQSAPTRSQISLIWRKQPATGVDPETFSNFAVMSYGDTPESYQWKPDSYFQLPSGYHAAHTNTYKDGYQVYLDPAVFPKGEYEVRIKRGLQIAYSEWGRIPYTWSGGAIDFYESNSSSAPYTVSNPQDDQNGVVIVETVTTKSDDYPFTQGNLTLIAIKAVGVEVGSISADFQSWAESMDRYLWHFDDDIEDWTVNVATLTQSGTAINFAPTGSDAALLSPAINLDGGTFTNVRLRIKEITPSTGYQGVLRYITSGHGISSSYSKDIPEGELITGEYVEIDLDMTDLDSGGTDWIDNTITQIRFDLDDNGTGEYDIDWISIGVASGADWEEAPTNNPAALYRHVLASSLNSRALVDANIDDTELIDWYTRCLNKGYECNFVTNQYTVDQCKQIIAASGFAVPQQSEKWSVIQERDLSSDAPSQLFSQRNSRGMIVEKSFNNLPHAIVAEFFDADNGYLQAEELVYFPGYSALNATLFDTIRYDGITKRMKVRTRAKLDVDQLVYRQNRYVFESDMCHLVTPRGGLVAISNDFLSKIYDSAFIRSVTTDSGNITGLVLDGAVRIEAYTIDVFAQANIFTPADIFGDTSESAITIQENDGSTLTLDIDETMDTSTFTLSTPLADPGTIQAGLLVAVGRPGRVVKRCRIFNIERVSDFNARLTLVDEAPEIHQ